MFARFRDFLNEEPWRTSSILLGVGLLVSLVSNVTGGDSAPTPTSEQTAGSTMTSISSLGDETTTPGQGGPTSTEATPTATEPITPGSALVGIKVDNAPVARPQVGIGEAPLLVEYPVEGGITRFTAVFPRRSSGFAGPIRSFRPVDADLLPAIAPIAVSTGGRSFVLRDVEAAGVKSIVADLSSMFVSLGRPNPHDTFVNLDLLASILDDSLLPAGGGLPKGGPLPLMRAVALEVDSPFDSVSFVYEQGAGYVRQQNGEEFRVLGSDAETETILAHDTLVFLFAAERSAGYTDSNGAPVSDFDVIGSGRLLVFHEGEILQGTWSRSALADPFLFVDDIGEPFGLPEGHTYLAIVPRDREVEYR